MLTKGSSKGYRTNQLMGVARMKRKNRDLQSRKETNLQKKSFRKGRAKKKTRTKIQNPFEGITRFLSGIV
jgi:hypothetical protein